MTSAHIEEALQLMRKDPELDNMADVLLADLGDYFKGLKGRFVKQLVKRVKKRFRKDGVDDVTFGYIIAKLLREFDALDDLYSIFDEAINGKQRECADLIVDDMQSVLNGRLVKTFTSDRTPHDFVRIFEARMTESGLKTEQAAGLAKMLWEEVQYRLGV